MDLGKVQASDEVCSCDEWLGATGWRGNSRDDRLDKVRAEPRFKKNINSCDRSITEGNRPLLVECAGDEMSKRFWLDLALFLDRVHVDAIPEPFAPVNV